MKRPIYFLYNCQLCYYSQQKKKSYAILFFKYKTNSYAFPLMLKYYTITVDLSRYFFATKSLFSFHLSIV